MELAQKMLDENAGKPLTPKQSAFVQSAILTSKDVLIVDEAGMVSAKQMANIIELTKQSGAKLVLVGDPAQLQSVEAGATFRTLLERNDSVSLTEVRRQQVNWQRKATIKLSNGDVEQALKTYDRHGCITQAKNRAAAKAQLVKDVMQAQKNAPDASRLVLTYTRKDVNDLNAMIKAEMVKAGKVATKNVTIPITIKEADHDRQEMQDFAVGDRVLFRENNHDMGVMNGTFGTLQSVKDGRFHVALDNGNNVAFSPKEYSHFQLGYAATVHKSQGVTVDQTFVLATPHFDRHTTYVAMSRHTHDVKLYASKGDFRKVEYLYTQLGKDGEKLSTLDFTDARQKQRAAEKKSKTRPSFFQRIRQYFGRGEEKVAPERQKESQLSGGWIEKPTPTQQEHIASNRRLSQQEFIKLRDEFLQRAKSEQSIRQERQQERNPTLER